MRAGKQGAGRAISVAYGLDGDPVAVATVKHIFAEVLPPICLCYLERDCQGAQH